MKKRVPIRPKNTKIVNRDFGSIFLIQHYSIHDGPGFRTTVFMKGCALKCRWCQNPESWKPYPELMTRDAKCILCRKCIDICPVDAITLGNNGCRNIDREKCKLCFECVDICPTGALTKVGECKTVEDIVGEIKKDELFYYRSGGGVTISGGEPLCQPSFTHKLLKACKERGYHTALDTCGFAPWSALERVLEYVDLVLYDIKHMDPKPHKEATGKSNALILRNVRKIPRHIKVWLRIPLVPGYNDSDENLRKIGELGREIGAEKVSILPFNRAGEEKYRSIGRQSPMAEIEPPSKKRIHEVQKFIENFGLRVTVGE
ncbi:MAG TPA: glycyl-radical enzyme activating protein [Desulfatiglandales bacterium]|nr:glycyl-radical enzyme activating protein [Desulfatiglandales bacterium]